MLMMMMMMMMMLMMMMMMMMMMTMTMTMKWHIDFYLCSDLYQNKIRLWRHNYTALPKNLIKM